ncbi:Collagen alpha-1(XI) chain [Anabarilius grahami]|uniref:Collagen alpha-1(XI) chain n=1 Tax=Anabarilius grahami TaxID=495550 RepID=A0A3N0YMK3_ANAGA|nr:Collagen alpha-1(XI) chain [Anabarilius grahami]
MLAPVVWTAVLFSFVKATIPDTGPTDTPDMESGSGIFLTDMKASVASRIQSGKEKKKKHNSKENTRCELGVVPVCWMADKSRPAVDLELMSLSDVLKVSAQLVTGVCSIRGLLRACVLCFSHLVQNTEAIDLLDHLWQVANHSNASVTHESQRCPVLHVGQYSTLSIPLQQVFGHRFGDEFSLLLHLRSSQSEDRSVLTFLCPDGHILLQIRISAYTFTFISTQQRHYEFPVAVLSDGGWHRVAVSVSSGRLALYVDCSMVESVDWAYKDGLGISTDGLVMVGGIIEGFETPFEGDLMQVAFLMGEPDAARDQCAVFQSPCGGTGHKPPRSPHIHTLEELLLSLNDLEDLLVSAKDNDSIRAKLTFPGWINGKPMVFFDLLNPTGGQRSKVITKLAYHSFPMSQL